MNRNSKQVLTEWLVLGAQRGDQQAFKDLHDLWKQDLFRVAVLRVERPDVAQEVLTDVWLGIARGIGRLDDPACFPRWAFRIVELKSKDWIRRQVRERRREADVREEAETLAPAPAVPAEAPEDVNRLRAAIAGLPPEERRLLHLYYELGRSVGEIAELLDIRPGTVKSRLFSFRETLKTQLQKNHE